MYTTKINQANLLQGLGKYEKWLFLAVALFQLLMVWVPAWFFTYDGPAHLHNAHLLGEMSLQADSILHQWYQINLSNFSNWLYYLLATPLTLVLAPALIEKILVSLYVLVFAFGLRSYLCAHHPKSYQVWSYFGFYFIFHYNFMLGQYNFAFALALMWWVLTLGKQIEEQPNRKKWVQLGLLLWLVYTAHLVVFLLTGLFLGLQLLYQKATAREKARRLGLLALLSLLPLALSIHFVVQNQQSDFNQWLPTAKLLNELLRFQITQVYHPPKEFWMSLPLLSFVYISLLWQGLKNPRSWLRSALLPMLVVTIFFYFTMPDSTAGASFVSSRLATIAGLLLLCLAAALNNRYLQNAAILCALPALLWRGGYYLEKQLVLGNELATFHQATQLLRPNTLLHQMNYSPNWLHKHISMTVFKQGTVHVHNYEAGNTYFPLRWRTEKADILKAWRFLGDWPPCVDDTYLSQLDLNSGPDYYLRWFFQGPQNACDSTLNQWLTSHFELVHVSADSRLEIWQKPTP